MIRCFLACLHTVVVRSQAELISFIEECYTARYNQAAGLLGLGATVALKEASFFGGTVEASPVRKNMVKGRKVKVFLES